MAIDTSKDRSFVEILGEQVAKSENLEQVLSLLIARFRMISESLGPVIGNSAVTALFERSFHLAGHRYPWTLDIRIHTNTGKAFSSIAPLFVLRNPREAADAGILIASQFCDLLSGMVGYSLSERLLRPVLTRSTSDLVVNENFDA